MYWVCIRHAPGHDGSGHAWQCEHVTVRNMARGGTKTWEFPCGEWFGTMAGHKLQRDLKVVGGTSGDGVDKRPSATDSESVYSVDES